MCISRLFLLGVFIKDVRIVKSFDIFLDFDTLRNENYSHLDFKLLNFEFLGIYCATKSVNTNNLKN